MAKKPVKKGISVHLPKMVKVALLDTHPKNPQVQSSHMFGELVESIQENGFDESLIVVPRSDGQDGYWIVSGNHRFMASKQLGLDELPVVIRDDWDDVRSEIELVKRNYVKGKLDNDKFTNLVNHLSKEKAIPLDVIYEQMGFEDEQMFAKFYKAESEKQQSLLEKVMSKKEISIVEHVDHSLSEIFEKYGATAPSGFVIFPAGGKRHIFVHSNAALKISIDKIVMKCLQEGLNINVVLGGLLALAIKEHKLDDGVSEEVKKAGGLEGPDEIEFVTV
jgi:hypothetical protein